MNTQDQKSFDGMNQTNVLTEIACQLMRLDRQVEFNEFEEDAPALYQLFGDYDAFGLNERGQIMLYSNTLLIKPYDIIPAIEQNTVPLSLMISMLQEMTGFEKPEVTSYKLYHQYEDQRIIFNVFDIFHLEMREYRDSALSADDHTYAWEGSNMMTDDDVEALRKRDGAWGFYFIRGTETVIIFDIDRFLTTSMKPTDWLFS